MAKSEPGVAKGERQLECFAPDNPSEIWAAITQASGILIDCIRKYYPDFEICEGDLIYTEHDVVSADALSDPASAVDLQFTLLQKTLVATKGNTKGVAIVLTWESQARQTIYLRISRSVARETWLEEQTVAIIAIATVVLVCAAAIYLGVPSTRGKSRLGALYLLAIAIVPAIILGFILKFLFGMVYVPHSLIQGSDSFAADLLEVALASLQSCGWNRHEIPPH